MHPEQEEPMNQKRDEAESDADKLRNLKRELEVWREVEREREKSPFPEGFSVHSREKERREFIRTAAIQLFRGSYATEVWAADVWALAKRLWEVKPDDC
jgi:hypothetical protein